MPAPRDRPAVDDKIQPVVLALQGRPVDMCAELVLVLTDRAVNFTNSVEYLDCLVNSCFKIVGAQEDLDLLSFVVRVGQSLPLAKLGNG